MNRRALNSAPIVAGLISILLFAGGNTFAQSAPPHTLRVLFVGNSLTGANDLPLMVQKLADSRPSLRLEVHSVVLSGASLDDHWDSGEAARAIQAGHWDIVVLQQGPSALPESRVLLLAATKKFASLIRKSGAKPALYMVWPSAQRSGDFDAVRESYSLAARGVDGIFFPAGEAWRAAWRRNPKLALYGPDGFHPTVEGTYLAALVIAGMLCECSARDLPSTFQLKGGAVKIAPSDAAVLQDGADEAVRKFGRK